MQLPIGTALIIVAIFGSLILVLEREDRWSPLIALVAGALQVLLLFDIFDVLRNIWRIDFILPAVQFIAAYQVWNETEKKRAITASTVVLVVTMIEMAFLLGRLK